MAINPLIDQGRGRFRLIKRNKKSSTYKFVQKEEGIRLIHFIQHKPSSGHTRVFVDDGDGIYNNDIDPLVGGSQNVMSFPKRRKGRFTVESYRIEKSPDMEDKAPGWVGPGTLIGFNTRVTMNDEFAFEISANVDGRSIIDGWLSAPSQT